MESSTDLLSPKSQDQIVASRSTESVVIRLIYLLKKI